jgi:DNA-binding XRE family transcriptional regulator
MTDVCYRNGKLTVTFEDRNSGSVDVTQIVPPGYRNPRWEEVRFDRYVIVVPTDGDDLEIPWDVFRALTDAEFDAYLAASAEDSAKSLGRRIRELRAEARLSELELAERAGISPERLAKTEAGEDGISLPALERLVVAMGHDMRVFAVDDDDAAQI